MLGEGEVQGGGLRIAQVRFVKKQPFFVNILFLFHSLLFNCNALFVNLTEQIVNIIKCILFENSELLCKCSFTVWTI